MLVEGDRREKATIQKSFSLAGAACDGVALCQGLR